MDENKSQKCKIWTLEVFEAIFEPCI